MRRFWQAIAEYIGNFLSPNEVITDQEAEEIVEKFENWLEVFTGEEEKPATDQKEVVEKIASVEKQNSPLADALQSSLPDDLQALIDALPPGGRIIYDMESAQETGFIEMSKPIGMRFDVTDSSNVKSFSFYPFGYQSAVVVTYQTKGEERIYMYFGPGIIIELMWYLAESPSAGEAVWDVLRVRNGLWGAVNFEHHAGIMYNKIDTDIGEAI